MPKHVCTCGQTINLGNIPNDDEYLFISDVEYSEFAGNIESETLYRKFAHFLVCPACERLVVFWQGFGKDPVTYAKQG